MRKIILIALLMLLMNEWLLAQDATGDIWGPMFDTPAKFDGDLLEFIQSNLIYPELALRDSLEGTVIVQFWIDSLGFTSNHELLQCVREDLNKEALRVSRLIKFENHASSKGHLVRLRHIVPVRFYLREPEKAVLQEKQKRTKRKTRQKN